jgi:hypothetical protein
MANTILTKRKSTTGDPVPGDLEQGELAINTLDEKLFSKNTSDAIFEIGGSSNHAVTSIINADINTATPPTTEAVTAELIYRDLADDTDLATLGFGGNNEFKFTNHMRGGDFVFSAEDTAGTTREWLDYNPDNVLLLRAASNLALYCDHTQQCLQATAGSITALYYDGTSVAQTTTSALGGWMVDNDYTGGTSFERVLTSSDVHRGLPIGVYNYLSGVGGGDPGFGAVAFDSVTPASITQTTIGDEAITGHSMEWLYGQIAAGDVLIFGSEVDTADYITFTVDSTPVDSTGYWTIALTMVNAGTMPTNGQELRMTWVPQASAGVEMPVSTGASYVLRGDGAGGWVEETDLTISATGALTTTGSIAASDGTDSLSFSASGGAALFQPTGGMNSAEFNVRLIISDKLTVNNIFLDERASAGTDVTGDGQIWARSDPSQTLWFTPEGGTDYPIGYNSMPVKTVSASQNFLLAEVGYMMHKSSGGTLTLTCATDSNTWNGATWVVHNDDTEDLTIGTSGTTLYWLEAGSAPASGDVTIKQGGIVTIYKLSTTEFWAWGAKDASTGISDIVEDTTPELGGDLQSNGSDIDMADSDSIYFGAGNDGRIYSNGTDLYIDLAVTGDFRLRGGSASDIMITAFTNSFVQLAYDGTVKLSTTSGGVNIIGTLTADGVQVDDSQNITLGTDSDVDIYFNNLDMYIDMPDGADWRLRGGAANDNMIIAYDDAQVELYHNGGLEFRTQQHEASSVTSGAEVYDHAGVLRDVGFNHVKEVAVTTVTLSNLHAGVMFRKTSTGTLTITMASSSTEFPIGSMCTILNHGTGGSLTISDGSEAMYIMDGSGTVSDSTGFVLAVGGAITVWRQGASAYYVWGAGIP